MLVVVGPLYMKTLATISTFHWQVFVVNDHFPVSWFPVTPDNPDGLVNDLEPGQATGATADSVGMQD